MLTLANMYQPITGTPFRSDNTYCEIAPCEALRPYVRCFWGTLHPVSACPNNGPQGIVIPDTCMDIIFDINYSQNCYNGFFCTVDEHSYRTVGSPDTDTTATFAIRFYAWSAILFSEQDFTGRKNRAFSVEEFFGDLKAQLEPLIFDITSLREKIAITEGLMLKRLCTQRMNHNLMNAIHRMLETNCRADITEICRHTAISERQLERIFSFNLGVSPKTFSSLLRYQLLWQDMVMSPRFDILDAVDKYGYTDQSHLLNDFRCRHLMTPKEAIELAVKSR